jgi:transcriptional regulator with XRE-family HTH domain
MTSGSIGERVAAYRHRRGISQVALAGLVGRSESWLSQVERGIRSVDSMSVLLDLARVLKVEPPQLIGRPWDLAPNGDPGTDVLVDVRSFLTRYDGLLGEFPEPMGFNELHARIAGAHRAYQAARYGDVVGQLVPVLAGADAAFHSAGRSAETELALGYVSAYVLAAKVLTKLGASDLALMTADRAAHRALEIDSMVARGMSAYQVVCALLRADRSDEAEHLAVGMAGQLGTLARSDQPSMVSLAGALWLISAVIAGRRHEQVEAWARLDEAERLAGLLGEDANHAWTAFGPTNVLLHRISVATEMGDAAEAVRLAAMLDANRFPPELVSRRARVNLDLAWAQAQRRQDAEATLHLMQVESTAPEVLRYDVVARELIRDILARSGRSQTTALADLATRAGILD